MIDSTYNINSTGIMQSSTEEHSDDHVANGHRDVCSFA